MICFRFFDRSLKEFLSPKVSPQDGTFRRTRDSAIFFDFTLFQDLMDGFLSPHHKVRILKNTDFDKFICSLLDSKTHVIRR